MGRAQSEYIISCDCQARPQEAALALELIRSLELCMIRGDFASSCQLSQVSGYEECVCNVLPGEHRSNHNRIAYMCRDFVCFWESFDVLLITRHNATNHKSQYSRHSANRPMSFENTQTIQSRFPSNTTLNTHPVCPHLCFYSRTRWIEPL